MHRAAGKAAVLSLLLATAPAAALHAQVTEAEPTLLELRLGQVASRTLPALRVGNEALLPLGQFFDLAEVRVRIDSTGSLEATLEPRGLGISVVSREGIARAGNRRVVIPSGHVRFQDADLYLASSILSQLLEIEILVDWSTLEAVVLDPSRLPVAERARRARMRAQMGGATPDAVATQWVGDTRKGWDGFVLDYSWFAPGSDLIGGSSYAVAAGADLFGGSLEGSLRGNGSSAGGNVTAEGAWLGVWRGNRWLQQLRLGDGPASGPRSRSVRGVFLTNAPYVRPSLLGTYAYNGRLPAGWEIEAYRGGQLVGLDSVLADGSYAVDVPILFGENPVEFVAYGPFGERRTFSRTYRAHSALLPARTFEYAASGGACRATPCGALANADLRYGISRSWTAAAGIEQVWRDSLADLTHPYFSATGSLTHAWTIQAEAMANALLRGGIAFEPSLNLRLGADYTRFDTDVVASLVNPLNRRSQLRLAAFVRPDARRDYFYFDGTAEFATRAVGSSTRLHGSVSAQLGDLRVQPYARYEREVNGGVVQGARTFGGFSAFLVPSGRVGPLLRSSWIRASFEAESFSRPRLASISIARPLLQSFRAEAGVSWIRGSGSPTFTLTLATGFDALRTFTTMTAQSGAPASVTQHVQGSVLYDRAQGGVTFDAGPALQRAGVAGTVFLDLNGNGVRDESEEGLPNVRVQVGGGSAVSDSAGNYRVWDIVPFEPVLVGADSMSFDSPLWVGSGEVVAVIPSPNHFTMVDVPLRNGAVIEGRVTRAFGGELQGVAGATVEVIDSRHGHRRHTATFTDGAFYLLGVAPGEYEIRVGERTLELLGQTAAPVPFRVLPDGTGPAPVSIRLEPASAD